MNVAVCSLKGVNGSMCKHHIMNCKVILGLPHGIYIYIYEGDHIRTYRFQGYHIGQFGYESVV